jgi:hypothetical protein
MSYATEFDGESPDNSSQGVLGKAVEDLVLCYVTCPLEGDDFTGAILLTDARTRPMHFAFVQPVRPNKMQRILYGRTLEEHIKGDVVAQKLFGELPQQPDAVFVDTRELTCIRRVTKCVPVAFLSATSNGRAASEQLAAFNYDTGAAVDEREKVGAIVTALDTVDLLDPFDRLREALKEALQAAKRAGR